jgi:hypothetical protein
VSTVAGSAVKGTAFPSAEVADCLQGELIEVVKEDAAIRGLALPVNVEDILSLPAQVDSLVVVAILCAIEPIVGFELPESLVRTGGYRSVVTALDHLLPRIEKEWMKKKGVTS